MASLTTKSPKSNKDLIPIYTDWANHYLEKQQKRRLITDLQKDMQDSLFLLDVIEAVSEKVVNIKTKPKSANETVDNINACLRHAESLGASLDGINAKDIKDGQLKAILGLFFSLSRFKQQQKQHQQPPSASPQQPVATTTSQLTTPVRGGNSGLQQPTPTKMNSSRLPAPYNKGASVAPVGGTGIPSFSKSPSRLNHQQQPLASNESAAPAARLKDEQRRPSNPSIGRSPASSIPSTPTRNLSTNSTPTRSGLKPPATPSRLQTPSGLRASANSLSQAQPAAPGTTSNSKMLQKFKLFSKDKATAAAAAGNQSTKTSAKSSTRNSTSSSGFSSARSEASDTRTIPGDSDTLKATTKTAGIAASGKRAVGLKAPKPVASPCPQKKDIDNPPMRKRPSEQSLPLSNGSSSYKLSRDGKANEVEEDADSAYCGFDSSPTSSHTTTGSSSIGPRRSPVGAPSPPPATSTVTASTTTTSLIRPPSSSKPTMAVKGITSPVASIPKQGLPKPSNVPKPGSLLSKNVKKPESSADRMANTATQQQVQGPSLLTSKQVSKAVTQSPTVGIVSPIMQHKSTPISREREAAASATGGGHQSDSNSSQTSGSRDDSDSMSVIYCPTSAVSPPQRNASLGPKSTNTHIGTTTGGILAGSPTQTSPTRNRSTTGRLETTFDCYSNQKQTSFGEDDSESAVKPMEPLVPRASPYAAFRKPTAVEKQHHQMAQKPHLTFSRQIGSILNAATAAGATSVKSVAATNVGADGIRNAAGEVAGYVSDGDTLTAALQGPLADLTSAEVTAGYMSEGGISMYAQKMQARFREGLAAAARDSGKHTKRQHNDAAHFGDMMNDSFEDSSSISSGLSENLDDLSTDDLTGSSLSDAQQATSSSRRLLAAYQQQQHHGTPAQQLMVHQQRIRAAQQKQQQQQRADGSNLQQRKLTEQENIDQLLQKCRTSSRGLAVSPSCSQQHRSRSGGGMLVNSTPNGGSLSARQASNHRIQLSADGDTLRVQQHHGGRVPMLNLRKTDGTPVTVDQHNTGSLHRPGSAQGIFNGSTMNGYHSLDRKRHLIGYFSENEGAAYLDQYQRSAAAVNAATLAMVSPRHAPGSRQQNGALSLPVSHEGPIQDDVGWTGLSANKRYQSPTADIANGRRTFLNCSPAMSRSMIGSQELKLSPASPRNRHPSPPSEHPNDPRTQVTATSNGTSTHRGRNAALNAVISGGTPPLYHRQSPRLSLHNSAVSANGVTTDNSRSPYRQTNGYARKEGIYANLIQRTSTPSNGSEFVNPQSISYSGPKMDSGSPTAFSAPPSTGRSISVGNGQQPSPYMASVLSRVGADGAPASTNADEFHRGSALSLISNNSSVYSSAEEKYQAEIRKLHREVEAYREKVQTLTAQQSTYTSMVHAFEKALQGMVRRVEQLQITSQQKESEVSALRQKIQLLKELSSDMGINVDAMLQTDQPASALLQRRHTFTQEQQQAEAGLQRHPSVESVVSTTSQKSSISTSSKGSKADKSSISSKGKRSWIRSSFSKAFTKGKGKKSTGSSTSADATSIAAQLDFQRANSVEKSHPYSSSAGVAPPASARGSGENGRFRSMELPGFSLSEVDEEVVDKLKSELAKKDLTLTDVRLDALDSQHQVDQLKEALHRLKFENATLKQSNSRLQQMVMTTTTSRTGSQTSLPLATGSDDGESSFVSDQHDTANNSLDDSRDGLLRRAATVAVSFDLTGDLNGSNDAMAERAYIGQLWITPKTTWSDVDAELGRLLNEYLHKIDPANNLNLSNERLLGYRVGETTRHLVDAHHQQTAADWTPLKCLSANVHSDQQQSLGTIVAYLRAVNQDAVDALAFETLIPRTYLERLVDRLLHSRRLILSGGCGTGKSYLARKLADYVVCKKRLTGNNDSSADAQSDPSGDASIRSLALEEGGGAGERLKAFLTAVTSEWMRSRTPTVVIVDNLHFVNSLTDAFSALSAVKEPMDGPYILVTTNQNPSTNHLQLHHNFNLNRWINSRDPIQNFLGRYLMRRHINEECLQQQQQITSGERHPPAGQELVRVLEFLPKVWLQLNKFLETANSLDVSIGPRVFLSCPLDVHQARKWFIALWNEQVIPYLIQAAREGLAMYGRRGSLEDPTDFVCSEWPWSNGARPDTLLARLSADDISVDAPPSAAVNGGHKPDPLMMLVRLQQQQQMRLSTDE